MALLTHIDYTRPLYIDGFRYVRLQDEQMEKLAVELNQPNLLRCAEQVADTSIALNPTEARTLFGILTTTRGAATDWYDAVERNLQCMCEDDTGPLLTTNLSIDEFEAFLASMQFDLIRTLADQTKDWRRLGVEDVYIEGHELASSKRRS